MNNQHKTKKTVVDHPGNHTVLRTKGSQTFEWGYYYLNNFSYFFLLFFLLNVNIFYVKYLTQDSTK